MWKDLGKPLIRAMNDRLQRSPVLAALGADRPVTVGKDEGTDDPVGIRTELLSVRRWHSATFDGQEHWVRVTVDTAPGEGDTARQAVIGLLHDADVLLPGHAVISITFETAETDDRSTGGACRIDFRVLTVSD